MFLVNQLKVLAPADSYTAVVYSVWLKGGYEWFPFLFDLRYFSLDAFKEQCHATW